MTVKIQLTQGYLATVDDADAESVLSQSPWYAMVKPGRSPYAGRKIRTPSGGRKHLGLHAFLTGFALTDHCNGDGLDNRRANLRVATNAQNGANKRKSRSNTSGYIGVNWHKSNGKWMAYIKSDYKQIHLGYFTDPAEAARAVDAAKIQHHGEFARLNFPPN